MKSKTQQARELMQAGDLKGCLAIMKTFRMMSPEMRKGIGRAYECIIRPGFYQQLGVDTKQAIETGKTLAQKYLVA